MPEKTFPLSAWFAGPKAENSEDFRTIIQRIFDDHLYWRRNYFPEDGVIITSETKRTHGAWNDLFEDHLLELLSALKADFPFHSPRYAAHMLAEQTLPSIAGYFAGMLYNPNNVTREAAPVTVELELEVGRILGRMLGYDPQTSWTHLTSGGTVANIEALWVARTVMYLPLILRDMSETLDLASPLRGESTEKLLAASPSQALNWLVETFDLAAEAYGPTVETLRRAIHAYQHSPHNPSQQGMYAVLQRIGSEPVLFAPESMHYCLPKAVEVLGLGRESLRSVRVDYHFRMDTAYLQQEIEQAEKEGKHVMAVIAVAGTTEEGAIDPLHEVVAYRNKREAEGAPSFWLHADAAYGGYLRTMLIPERLSLGERWTTVTHEGQSLYLELALPEKQLFTAFEALGSFDSIVVDPHKLGYIPYPAGAVSFRSNLVRPILRQNAPYLDEPPKGPRIESRAENIGVYILEGSKPGASAASVWLSHTTIPLDNTAHGRLMRETIRNAAELHALLLKWPELHPECSVHAVPLTEPDSNIVCYAFRPKSEASLAQINQLNRRLFDHFGMPRGRRFRVYDQQFFVSRTLISPEQYRRETLEPFLKRLHVSAEEYEQEGIFLLRSVLMNPWYSEAKKRGRFYLVDLTENLHLWAERFWNEMTSEGK